jgi:CheY-like chemotaxis protein/two-component sensor histidine kinase
MPLQAQKMEVIGRLASAVIHDLNNLLTVIQLNASLVETGELDKEETIESARQIGEAAKRSADLTRKVLNFARRQADEIRTVSLDEIVGGLERLLEPLIAHRVRIEIVSESGCGWVKGDRSAIEQAVMNLVLNAVESMHDGGTVRISCSSKKLNAKEAPDGVAGRYVVVAVRDSGEGIPLENQGQIFEPFFTTKHSGTGMGLAIVNRVARIHGGAVDFTSEIGHGTEFRFVLPESDPPGDEQATSGGISSEATGDYTVLLVEDDPGILDLTRRLLESDGLRVLAAASGEEAMDIWNARSDEVDLLFTDIVLPGALSGREVAQTILEEKPMLPVLYTSGYSNAWEEKPVFQEANFLAKPFSPQALQTAVKSALAQG